MLLIAFRPTNCLPIFLITLLLSVKEIESITTLGIKVLHGTNLVEGDSFSIVCEASSENADLKVRLKCPISQHFDTKTDCYEGCEKPYCYNNPCGRFPEIASSDCTKTVEPVSKIKTVTYKFYKATQRNNGAYECVFGGQTSGATVSVGMKPTTTRAKTTNTASRTTSSITSITTDSSLSTSSSPSSVTPRLTTKAQSHTTKASTVTVDDNDKSTKVTSSKQPPIRTVPPLTTSSTTITAASAASAGWYFAKVVGELRVSDLIVICLVVVIIITWLIVYFCIRCHIRALIMRKGIRNSSSRCCHRLLCISTEVEKSNQFNGRKANGVELLSNRRQNSEAEKPLTISDRQEYDEAGPDAGYYSPAVSRHDADDYYRLQTDFDAAPAQTFGGSQRGLQPKSSFFSRDLPARHSFHNIRAPRQRPSIPHDLIHDVSEQQQEMPAISKEEFQQQVEQQRREIETLREQLRNSQLQLSRINASQQDLRRSISFSKIKPEIKQQQQQPSEAGEEYELCSRSAAPIPGTAAANVQAAASGIRGSGDLVSVEPIAEEASDGTLRRKRQGSISEAYGTGTLTENGDLIN